MHCTGLVSDNGALHKYVDIPVRCKTRKVPSLTGFGTAQPLNRTWHGPCIDTVESPATGCSLGGTFWTTASDRPDVTGPTGVSDQRS